MKKQNIALLVLGLLLAATIYGVARTGREGTPRRGAAPDTTDSAVHVDKSSLTTIEALLRLPTTAAERPFAEDAFRLSDQEMDLAFADAVRSVGTQPRTLSKDAQAIQARLLQSQRDLAEDQDEVTRLTAQVKAPGSHAATLEDQLSLAKAHVALHEDEVDDAKDDLIRAGGDPQGRIQAMIEEHEASSKHSDSIQIVTAASADRPGLINHFEAWWGLRSKIAELSHAEDDADTAAARYGGRHATLEAKTSRDDGVAEPGREATGPKSAAGQGASAALSHEASAALVRSTQQRASDSKARLALDRHADDQRKLAATYAQWTTEVERQRQTVLHRALRSLAVILIIIVIGLLIDRWIEHVLDQMTMDRRRLQTLYMVVRVSLQVVGALFILLVLFGPPNNLGTFLGLAGAGLTVALKDFIVSFIGWFTLMGKDGIRIGDLVEINGVTGEVVELGLFHTVLLETGSWSDAGHPTGRRVTFTNSFAIEGHYFNFSTSGQWLWDDVRVVVPAGRDPYPIANAIREHVEGATAETVQAAELHWKGTTRRSPNLSALTAAPAVNIKPVVGGTEITVRYVTHVSQRTQLRSALYHLAVDLLGDRKTVATPPATVRV